MKARIIEPHELETRDLIRDPDALECLSNNRAAFLRDADKRLVTEVARKGVTLICAKTRRASTSTTVWKYGPSWANAFLDEIWAIRHSYRTTLQHLLRRATDNMTIRDAVITAILAGDRFVLRLAQQQRSEYP